MHSDWYCCWGLCWTSSWPSGDKVLAWINFRTTVLKAKHCSISWHGAPWWKAQERLALYPTGNLFGTGGGSLVWIRFSLSSVGNSSAYFTGIGSNRDALWAWFWVVNRWRAYCRGCCGHSGWSCVAISEDTRLVNFSTSARSVVTSSRSSWTSCLSWSISRVCASVCICELKLKEDIGPLLTFLWKRKPCETRALKLWNATWCMMFMQK